MVLQPGSFRTEGMSRNPFLADGPIPAYAEMRKQLTDMYDSVIGKETGDPVKGMSILVDIVRSEGVFEGREMPLWFAMGSDSERDFRERARRVLESLDANKDISMVSDFD